MNHEITKNKSINNSSISITPFCFAPTFDVHGECAARAALTLSLSLQILTCSPPNLPTTRAGADPTAATARSAATRAADAQTAAAAGAAAAAAAPPAASPASVVALSAWSASAPAVSAVQTAQAPS